MVENTTNFNIKTSTLITGVAIVVFAISTWALSELYSSLTHQIKVQWQKLDKLEKVVCSKHSDICRDL